MERQDDNIELWKTCVEMADSTSKRRDVTNNVFITFHIALISTISIAWSKNSIFIAAFGIVLSVFWILFIYEFKKLNHAKFKVIKEIEDKLAIAPFDKEWEILHKTKYLKLTNVEFALAAIFDIFYIVYIILVSLGIGI